MNLDTNRGSRSLMTFLGRPWSLNTLSLKIWAAPTAVSSILTASRIILFKKRSTITKIASQLFESGKGPIKSQEITSQGRVGVSLGCKGEASFWRFGLVLWQASHPET